MFYDLNEYVKGNKEVDSFTIAWVHYELGPISEKYKKMISSIDDKTDVISAWRPVVAWLMSEWNHTTPTLTELVLGAIIPIIIKKLHADHS